MDLRKPVQTRDGRAARIIKVGQEVYEGPYLYPVRAEVEHPNEPGQWVAWNYMADGRWKSNDPRNHNDLVNERPWHRWMRSLRSSL